jgi:hypothetical protein
MMTNSSRQKHRGRDRRKGKIKPEWWVEKVVIYSALSFRDRLEYGLDLRREFRRKARIFGIERADRFARTEALKWLMIWWPLRIVRVMVRVVSLVGR